jgi:hypothetical protein
MRSWERLPFTQWADIQRTERYVTVEVRSGHRMILPENDDYTIHLTPDSDDEALGRALLEGLDMSRFIWPEDEPEFFEWQRYVKCARDWEKDVMRRYGYKTRHDFYKNMNWCRAERSEGKLSIVPHKRDKPGLWTDLSPEQTVIIPATRNLVDLGTALRLALNRCE